MAKDKRKQLSISLPSKAQGCAGAAPCKRVGRAVNLLQLQRDHREAWGEDDSKRKQGIVYFLGLLNQDI